MKTPSQKTLVYGATGLAAAFLATSAVSLYQLYYRRPDWFPVQRPWLALPQPGEPKRVGVVYNPTKERAQSALNILYRKLAHAGWEPARLYETEADDPGYSMAKQAVSDGAEIVLAVGGDGTVREVAAALKDTDIPMGIVPMGTGNLMARNLGYDVRDISSCISLALFGEALHVDTVHLRSELTDGTVDERDYLVMGGAGFDAHVMIDTDPQLKTWIGSAAYFVAATKHLLSRRRPVRITVEGQVSFVRRVRAVLMVNCGQIQGGINIAAKTTATDGQLEVVVLSPKTLFSWAHLTVNLIRGKHMRTPMLDHIMGDGVEVDFLKHPQPIEVDGDLVGEARKIHAKIQPQSLWINAPSPNKNEE